MTRLSQRARLLHRPWPRPPGAGSGERGVPQGWRGAAGCGRKWAGVAARPWRILTRRPAPSLTTALAARHCAWVTVFCTGLSEGDGLETVVCLSRLAPESHLGAYLPNSMFSDFVVCSLKLAVVGLFTP